MNAYGGRRCANFTEISGDGPLRRSWEDAGLPKAQNKNSKHLLKQVRALKGFHVPEHLYSDGHCVRLPTTAKRKQFKWNLDRPRSLAYVQSDEELSKCLMEGMVAWLNLYQLGYLHRNINMMDVLLCDKTEWPSEWPSFSLNLPQLPPNSNLAHIFQRDNPYEGTYLKDFSGRDEIWVNDYAKEVEGLVRKAGFDGGLSVCLSTYDGKAGCHIRAGSDRFLSNGLRLDLDSVKGRGFSMYLSGHLWRESYKKRRGYIHNPIDDFKAFLYVFLYAIILRTPLDSSLAPYKRHRSIEYNWLSSLDPSKNSNTTDKGRSSLRRVVFAELYSRTFIPPHSEGTKQSRPNMNSWEVDKLYLQWRVVANKLRMDCRIVEEDLKVDAKERLALWHLWAYKGMAEFLEAYIEHKESMKLRKK